MGPTQLYERGAAHRGVVGPRCARAAGIAPETFVARCRRQLWPELRPRVFLLPGWPDDAAARTYAAALASGADRVVTGWAALAQLELTRSWPSIPELLVPASARTSHLSEVRTRWTTTLPQDAIVDVAGVRFTDTARSLAHVAGRTPLARLRAIGFDAISRDLLRLDQLDREVAARGRFPGRGVVRQLIADLQGDGSESGFEFDTRERLASLGLQPDPAQPVVRTPAGRDRRIDIAFGGHLVGIECVGFGHHSSPEHLEADVVRSNEFAELDRWLILRLTFRMFHERWEPFVAQLRRCLAHRVA